MNPIPTDVLRRGIPVLGFGLCLACHPAYHVAPQEWDSLNADAQRARIVADADELVHAHRFIVENRRFSNDCSGFVGAVLLKSGIDVFKGADDLQIKGNGVRILYEYVAKYGSIFDSDPEPGDLVFFSNTYDRNRDRRTNDSMTHVGIVESTDAAGTVTFVHRLRGRAARYVMNLARPDVHKTESGEILNSYLRERRRRDPPGTKYLAGGLFTAFGSLIPEENGPVASADGD